MKPQKKLLTTIVLASLALTGCGGGGGSASSPGAPPGNTTPGNTNVLNNPPQLWAPFYSVTTVTGAPDGYGNLSVDSIAIPSTNSAINGFTTFDGINTLTNLQNIDSSGMLSPTSLGFTVGGIRYFFFSSKGKLYALDLTSTSQPVATPWGNLGIAQICGIQAEQFDGSGLTGDVIVSGVPTGSTLTCSSPSTWIVPFKTPSTMAIAPLAFHEFLVATFISATTSNINTTGYVIGVTANSTSTVNYTTDPGSAGMPITGIPAYYPATDSLASDRGGNATNKFVWVYNHSATPATSTLYSVSNNGTATQVIGLPTSNLSNNTATDYTGNLYLAAISGTTGPFTVQVFQVPVAGGAAIPVSSQISAGDTSTISILTNLSVNQLGNAGVLTVTLIGSGTPTQTNQNFVLNLTSKTVTHMIASNASNAMQFLGLDGSAVINAQDPTTSTQTDVYAVNLGTGTNISLPNMAGISQLWSSNLIGLPNVDTVAYGSFLALGQSGTVSVIETKNYTTTGQFILPAGSTAFYPSDISSKPNYILGMELGSSGNLFAVTPAATPANVFLLGKNSSTITWNGY